jgi:hypothetical protein
MNISEAKYKKLIFPKLSGSSEEILLCIGAFIPCDPNNRHYAEILKQVKEGTLTIKDAD